jgi:hypothetical protein
MKNLLIIWVFVCLSFSGLHARTNIIYVDRSNISDVKSLITVVEKIVQEKPNEDFLVYISNDMYPVILTDMNLLSRDLEVLFKITPSAPLNLFEVDSLNALINSKLQKQNDAELNEKVNLFFILDGEHAINSNQTKYLIQRLLLINGWTNKEGLSDNVIVSAYFKQGGYQGVKMIELKELYNDKEYEINLF